MFKYGPPRTLLSHCGPPFVVHVFQRVCQILGVASMFTTTSHLQCNGHVEHFNCTITSMLRCYIAENQAIWYTYASVLCFSYSLQTHSATATSPFDSF